MQTVLVAGSAAVAAGAAGRLSTDVRYALIVLLSLAMGVRNAVARRLAVPGLTTTVLTLTLTGLAADPATGAATAAVRPGRRLLSVLAMFLGALGGGALVPHDRLVLLLTLTLLLLAVIAPAAHRFSRGDADWVRRP
ncbi:DUF1275 family protein [Streptomyces sp. B93]|uniref:DUF1275 family protein n=1 Tax=Streptomyces sp. B93 TaxID=2824875 RepID=UPI001B35AA9C|nr:DUF1275 family protein [Streptomyces sp. B93]MBQ1088640.1 DUF1275 family protein [Streptomyces sp. B93]